MRKKENASVTTIRREDLIAITIFKQRIQNTSTENMDESID